MIFKYYNSKEAKNRYDQRISKDGFSSITLKDSDYIALREELVNAYKRIENRKPYNLDLSFGLELFEIINKKEWFKPSLASNYSFWKHVALEVIPDIIYERHGVNKEYYYYKNVRLYPSTIYWYINLFYKGSKEKTFDFLNQKCFTTDTIMQTVERLGRKGVDMELFMEIIEQYSKIEESQVKLKCGSWIHLLRKVMVQHTAKSVVLIPDFYQGGKSGYVKMLFNIVLGDKKDGK